LIVKYQNDRFESDVLTYTYFANPVLNEDPLSPSCGPVEGFTQITVRGKNFVEFHFGQAKCIFNETMYMNATVLNSDTLVCDAPVLDTTNPEMWYKVAVTLDGTYVTNTTGIFRYYREPTMSAISPVRGPISGGTTSVI
jgi:large repetitive protein